MSDIVLSSAVRSNLLSLQTTAKLMGQTQERLATGLKVNSALDDPTAFFTAAGLNNRASDLNRLLDSVGLAVETLKAADQGISAITKLVESAQATARQALQSPNPAATPAEVASTGVDYSGDPDLSALDGETLSINGNVVYTFTNAANGQLANIVAAIDGVAGVSATVDASNNLVITADDDSTSIEIAFSDAGVGTALGLAAGTTDPTLGSTQARTDLQQQFNDLLVQIDQLANDAHFNGNNLLRGDDLKVIFNEDGSSSLTIKGVTFTSDGLGISALSGDEFQDDAAIQATLDELDAALTTLRTQASTFGSDLSVVETRQDFTKNLINVLESGAGGLTLADTNEEGANMLALQTRQQLSTVALSLASQADQSVLRLF